MTPEQQLQVTVAEYLALALPPDAFFSAIGHGGGGKIRGAILKAMGLKPGVPDILIVHRGRVLLVELKTAEGRLSKAQIETHIALGRAGAFIETCRSIKEIEAVMFKWEIPNRVKAT